MKLKKKILPIFAIASLTGLPLATSTLTSCSRLHIHTFTSDYECDETHHWKTCKVCHEKFDYAKHTFNDLTDKCIFCGYQDPLVHIDPQTGEMVTLTQHGKNKLTFKCPSNVTCIGHHAFTGSKAKIVVINKECNWYWEDAFEDSDVIKVSYEEGMVNTHEEIDVEGRTKIVIEHVLQNKVAMVGNNYFETLKEAIESTTLDDVTVTLLQKQINETEPIKINHAITLVPYHNATSLKCNFDIGGAGIVYIPDTITYEGEAKLLLSTYREIHSNGDNGASGNAYADVYNTGSIVFTNTSIAPANVKVSYVTSFGSAQKYEAVGSQQVVNTLLVLPTDNYAWGTFRFSKDFKQIWGLTLYGQTVNHLYMTNVVKGIDASVAERSFTIGWDIYIDIPDLDDGHDFMIRMFITKGWFFHLTIGKGITSIGKAAFNAHVEGDLPYAAVDFLYPVFSHLFTLDLGPDLQTVGDKAFWGSVALKTVKGGTNLKSIGEKSFEGSYNLVSVDFSKSTQFNKIGKIAFGYCYSLLQVALPDGMWSIGDGTYFPYNTLPERIAYTLVKSTTSEYTRKNLEPAKYWYTKSIKVDSETGWFNDVVKADTLDEALKSCPDGGEIYLSSSLEKEDPRTINKSALKNIKTGVTLTAAPEISDAKYIDSNDGVTINPNQHLILSNVEPQLGEGKNITILSTSSDEDGKFTGSGSFAIDGLTLEKRQQIKDKTYLSNGKTNIKASANSASIRGTDYDTFGLYDFNLAKPSGVNTATISGLSTFGKMASKLTFGSPINDTVKTEVVLDKGAGSLPTNSNLFNVNIDDSVVQIGNGFFDTVFEKLQSVTIGPNVKSLGEFAFGTLKSLKTVDIQSPNLELSRGDFKNCYELATINLPANLKVIPRTCFYGCRALANIDIPSTVETIVEDAFLDCTALISVSLPEYNNLSKIEAKAFRNCYNLVDFDFGQNVNNWYVDNGATLIPSYELSNPIQAAALIRIDYAEKEWVRKTN